MTVKQCFRLLKKKKDGFYIIRVSLKIQDERLFPIHIGFKLIIGPTSGNAQENADKEALKLWLRKPIDIERSGPLLQRRDI